MSINAIISCNGTELTEHNRRISIVPVMQFTDFELASGAFRRYRKPSFPKFSLSWSYLPDKSERTADLRVGRDFIYQMARANALVTVSVQENIQDEWQNYSCMVTSYSENVLRNDMISQCKYFDVSLELTAV